MFLDTFAQRPSGFPDITLVTVLALQRLMRRRFVFVRYKQLAKYLVGFERNMYPRFLVSSA